MPDKDILGLLSKDPLYQQTAKATDDLIGSHFQERIQEHDTAARAVATEDAQNRTLRALVPNGAPLGIPNGPTIGTPPQIKPLSEMTPAQQSREYGKQMNGLMRNTDAWVDKSKQWSKPFGFDTGESDAEFDRYYAYGKPFQKLGYSPFRDNEALYNANTSWWDDFNRMRSVWPSLAGSAFKSVLGNPFDFSADTKMSADFEKNMKVAMSSKEGLGAKFTNMAANSAFTLGIAGEMLAENIVMGAAGLALDATGFGAPTGVALEAGVIAKTANNLRRLAQGSANLAKITKRVKSTNAAFQSIEGISQARALWKTVKTGGGTFLKGMGTFETGGFIKKLATGADGFDKLSDFAMLRKGVGSLYLDVRELNYAVSESRMEGGSVQNNIIRDLNNEYFAEHGKMAEGDSADRIAETASKAGNKTSLINVPMIYLTNKLVFGKGFRGFRPSDVVRAEIGSGIGGTLIIDEAKRATGQAVAEVVGGAKKFLKAGYWKQAPMAAAGSLLRYTQANWSEGLQESIQDVIATGTEEYYKHVYENPAMAGNRQAWGAFEGGVVKQFGAQGAETFLSGFLMGGLVGPVQTLIYKNGWEAFQKATDRPEYDRIKNEQKQRTNTIVNAINKMDPKQYFNVLEENMVTQVSLDKLMDQGEETDDAKQFHDAKSDSMFSHFHAMLETGNFDYFVSRLKDLKTLSPQELQEVSNNAALNNKYNASGDMYERIDKVVARAEQVKRRYDEVQERFQNEPNMYKYSKTKNPIEFEAALFKIQAYRMAKKEAIYASYGFDDTLDRMETIMQDLNGRSAPLSKVNASKFTILFNKSQIDKETDVLRSEADIYATGTPEQKRKATVAKASLEKLERFSADRDAYENAHKSYEAKKGPKTDVTASLKDLKKSYFAYIKHLGAQEGEIVLNSNLETSFKGLRDHIKLGHDANRFGALINILHDPENFLNIVDRLQGVAAVQYKTRAEAMLKGFEVYKDREDQSGLLNAIYNIGVFIDPDTIDSLEAGNLEEVKFLLVAGEHGEVDINGEFFNKKLKPILEKFKLYKDVVRDQAPVAAAPAVAPVVAPVAGAPVVAPVAPIVPTPPVANEPTPAIGAFEKQLIENQKYLHPDNGGYSTEVDKDGNPTKKFYVIMNPQTGKYENYKRITNVIPDDFDGDSTLYGASRTAGNTVDGIVREYFNTGKVAYATWKDKISESAFTSLENSLKLMRDLYITTRGMRILTSNGLLYDRNLKIAGTVDILAIDKDDNIEIFDTKTMKFGKYDAYAENYVNAEGKKYMSKKENNTNQLTGYDILVNNQYNKDVKARTIVPFEHVYDSKGFITKLEKREDKDLTYNREIEKLIPRTGGTKKGLTTPKPAMKAGIMGKITVDVIENMIQTGEATTTIRTDRNHEFFYKGDGVYETKAGNLINVIYKGKVSLKKDRIVGDNVSYSLNDFAKAEGFKTWDNFKKTGKYAAKDLIEGKSVHLYEVSPSKGPVAVEPGKIIYATVGSGIESLVAAYPDRFIDGDVLLLNHLKALAQDYASESEGEPILVPPASPKEAGWAFREFLATREKDEAEGLIAQAKDIFKRVALSGKTVLTSNWFAREIADEAYITKDRKKIEQAITAMGTKDSSIKSRVDFIMSGEVASNFKKGGVKIKALTGTLSKELLNREPAEQKLFEEISKKIAELSPAEVDGYYQELVDSNATKNLTTETIGLIDAMVTARKKESVEKFKVSKAKEGNVVRTTNGKKSIIVRKTKDSIVIKDVNDSNAAPVTMTKKQAQENIKKVIKPAAEVEFEEAEEDIMSEEDIAIAQENAKITEEASEFPAELHKDVVEGIKDPAKANDLFNALTTKCKT